MSVSETALKVVAERPSQAVAAPAGPPGHSLRADTVAVATPSDPRATFLADLILHQATETPMCVALLGGAGTGKSTLLAATGDAVEALARGATAAGLATPFVGDAAVVRLTVEPDRDPYASLLHQACVALGGSHPELVAGAARGFEDPHAAAREAEDRLSHARHRLDDERQRLDELSARQARLVDTVLFEGAGSRVDAYARANRGRIERALRRFGFAGDLVAIYKEFVRDAAAPGLGRGLGWLSAFWAYRGQLRLILVALAFVLLAWAVGALSAHQAELVDALRASYEKMGPGADWLAAHAAWLDPVRQILEFAGAAALVMNIVRAVRFIQPMARGATLLRIDLEVRRRDLDGLLAHHAKRVEGLARDVERANAQAAEAERRLGASTQPDVPAALRGKAGPAVVATQFFSDLSSSLTAARPGAGTRGAPTRLVIAVDGFERVPALAAAAFLEAVHQCLGRPGVVTLLAADVDHLTAGLAEADPALARAKLDRIVQIPMALAGGEEMMPWSDARSWAQMLLRPEADDQEAAPSSDVGRSAFDKPWLPKEAAVLEALAPFAGGTPRTVKRFINVYRVARADLALGESAATDLATLALGLALGARGGLPPASLLTSGAPLSSELQAARHAAATALGVALDLGRDRRGLEVARRYAIV